MKMVNKKFLVVVLLMLGMQVSVKAQWPWQPAIRTAS